MSLSGSLCWAFHSLAPCLDPFPMQGWLEKGPADAFQAPALSHQPWAPRRSQQLVDAGCTGPGTLRLPLTRQWALRPVP